MCLGDAPRVLQAEPHRVLTLDSGDGSSSKPLLCVKGCLLLGKSTTNGVLKEAAFFAYKESVSSMLCFSGNYIPSHVTGQYKA